MAVLQQSGMSRDWNVGGELSLQSQEVFAMASASISVSTEVPSAWKPVPLKAALQRTGKVKHQVGAGNPHSARSGLRVK